MDATVAVFFMRHAKRQKKEMSIENVSQLYRACSLWDTCWSKRNVCA